MLIFGFWLIQYSGFRNEEKKRQWELISSLIPNWDMGAGMRRFVRQGCLGGCLRRKRRVCLVYGIDFQNIIRFIGLIFE